MTRSPLRLVHPHSRRKGRCLSAFTVVELLVVVAVIVVMTGLSVPAFNAVRGGTDFTSEVYDVAGTLDQARSYAMANNTYVLAGIAEVPAQQGISATPEVTGTGRIIMAIIASAAGTRPYQSLLNTGSLENWPISGYGTGAAFQTVTKLLVLQNIHMVDLQNSTSVPPQEGSMMRPAVGSNFNLSNDNGISSTQFAWPLGTTLPSGSPQPQTSGGQQPLYVFTKVIEFDPQGCARILYASNNQINPDTIPPYIEIGLQPANGAAAAGPPSSQSDNAGQIAAIQINGISGANHIYRP